MGNVNGRVAKLEKVQPDAGLFSSCVSAESLGLISRNVSSQHIRVQSGRCSV